MADVEIGHAGLHHHHVGPLLEVGGDLAQGLVGVGVVHLVGLLVPLQRAGRADRVAEGPIEGRGVLGRVGHDHRVLELVLLQRAADHADAAVHHVRGAEDVAAGLGLGERLFLQRQQRLVVEDHAVAHDPVMAVGVVGVERHVEQHAHLRDRVLDRAGGGVDEVVGVPGFFGPGRLVLGLGVGEERDAGDPEVGGPAGGLDRTVDGQAGDAGHRGDRLLGVDALAHEDRPDQVLGAQARLAHQVADPAGLAQAPGAREREGREAGGAHGCDPPEAGSRGNAMNAGGGTSAGGGPGARRGRRRPAGGPGPAAGGAPGGAGAGASGGLLTHQGTGPRLFPGSVHRLRCLSDSPAPVKDKPPCGGSLRDP